MTIDTLQKVLDALPGQRVLQYKSVNFGALSGQFQLWTAAPNAGSTPPGGSGEAPTNATAGALPVTMPGGRKLYLSRARIGTMGNEVQGSAILYDRLVHAAGLVGNVATEQVIDTAALTRWTGGEGVELWLEQWSTFGGSPTATFNYTNQDGTTGRTTTVAVSPVGSNRWQQVPLASGDTGVRAVHSMTLAAAGATAGNMGVVLVKRVAELMLSPSTAVLQTDKGGNRKNRRYVDWLDHGLPEIADGACLALALHGGSVSSGNYHLDAEFVLG